jgi:hypothetical protein
LRVPSKEVEARVLTAIENVVMTPENVAYAAEQALASILVARAAADPKKLKGELDRLQVERDPGLDAYMKGIGDPAELEARLKASLERKRELQRRLAEAEASHPDLELLRPTIEAAIRDLRGALAGDTEARRDALRALLGAERLRVYPDAEKGFRLEGAVRLRLEAPAPVRPGRGLDQVAGG